MSTPGANSCTQAPVLLQLYRFSVSPAYRPYQTTARIACMIMLCSQATASSTADNPAGLAPCSALLWGTLEAHIQSCSNGWQQCTLTGSGTDAGRHHARQGSCARCQPPPAWSHCTVSAESQPTCPSLPKLCGDVAGSHCDSSGHARWCDVAAVLGTVA
jgi:hypothetical protein